MAEAEDRTQDASDRRRDRARSEGQAPISREVVTAAGLGAAGLIWTMSGPGMIEALVRQLRVMLTAPVGPAEALRHAGVALLSGLAPIVVGVGVAGAFAVLLQSGFLLHGEAALPDLARLSPARGLKRVFSGANATEALKSLIKLAVLLWCLWSVVGGLWPGLPTTAAFTTTMLMERTGRDLIHLLLLVFGVQAGIAVLDLAWVRWRFSQRLRMSREDLKQEHREAEGDPKVKSRLRQLRAARAKRRMLAAVAKSTVIITNPTHYAIALSYERGTQAAPRVVAKGVDEMAARMREAASRAGVPLVPNPPLARALYEVPLDAEVPAEHFKVVAEIIAYVWRLRNPAAAR